MRKARSARPTSTAFATPAPPSSARCWSELRLRPRHRSLPRQGPCHRRNTVVLVVDTAHPRVRPDILAGASILLLPDGSGVRKATTRCTLLVGGTTLITP